MDIRQLFYFVTVVNEGNITAAARMLHMSQPPLSTQIRLLEEELGCNLFDRSTRHIQLTDAGRMFYERACNILDLCTSAKNEMADFRTGKTGTLRIGVVSSVCNTLFLSLMEAYCKENGKIKYEIYEANTYQLLEKVRSNQIELAFVRTPFAALDLDCIFLKEEPMCAIGKWNFWENIKTPTVTLANFKECPIIIYRRWEQILRNEFQKEGIKPNIFCINDDARTTVNLALAGLGVGIVPLSVLPANLSDDFLSKDIENKNLHSKISIVYRKNMYISSCAKQFIHWIPNNVI